MTTEQELLVYRKLHQILTVIAAKGPLAKDKTNAEQHYKYLSEAAVKELLQPLLVEHKLLYFPIAESITKILEPAQGKSSRVTTVEVTYRWVDVETGAYIEGVFVGSGADTLDKGPYKALTGGAKHMMCSTFQIPTGDDPEKDPPPVGRSAPQRKTVPLPPAQQSQDAVISEAQRKRLFGLCGKMKKDNTELHRVLANYQYESVTQLKVKDYDDVCRDIDPSLP